MTFEIFQTYFTYFVIIALYAYFLLYIKKKAYRSALWAGAALTIFGLAMHDLLGDDLVDFFSKDSLGFAIIFIISVVFLVNVLLNVLLNGLKMVYVIIKKG